MMDKEIFTKVDNIDCKTTESLTNITSIKAIMNMLINEYGLIEEVVSKENINYITTYWEDFSTVIIHIKELINSLQADVKNISNDINDLFNLINKKGE